MNKIKVIIVDDMSEFVAFFTSSLKKQEDIDILGTASSGEQAVALALELQPDIVLMDIQMETDYAGIEAGRQILNKLPHTKLIAVTIHEDSDLICRAFEIGFVDYILKSASANELLAVIRDCVQSDSYHKTNTILAKDLRNYKAKQKDLLTCFNMLSKISKSEAEILKALCSGMSYRDIASQRFVEEVSVRSMVAKITKKTQVPYIKDLIHKFNSCHFFDIYNDSL